MKAWKLAVIIVSVAVIAVSLYSALTVATITSAYKARGAVLEAALAKYHQAFIGDQMVARGWPMFMPRSGDRDASPLIGPRTHWIVQRAAWDRYVSALPVGERHLTLDPDLQAKLAHKWLEAGPQFLSGIDFTWMGQLIDFDYWDLDAHSPSSPDSAHSPEPGIDVVTWAKLRLLKGIKEREPASAILEVEELARLCATTESILTVIKALMLLELTDAVRQRMDSSGVGAAVVRLGRDPKEYHRILRALWGALAYAQLRTPPAYEDDWDHIAAGRCAALGHGLASAVTLRALLLPSHALEYEHLTRLLSRSPECRLRRLRRLWGMPMSTEGPLSADDFPWSTRVMFAIVPAGARLSGEARIAISEQDWFRQYD